MYFFDTYIQFTLQKLTDTTVTDTGRFPAKGFHLFFETV